MASQPFHPDIHTVSPINLLRATADPVRLRVLEILDDDHEYTCSDLAVRIGIPLPTMSHHLKTLREAGLTFNRKDGTTRWTSLRKAELEAHYPGLSEQLTKLAQKLPADESLPD